MKTLETSVGSSKFLCFSQESDAATSDFKVQALESIKGVDVNCVGSHKFMGSNAGGSECVVETFPENEGSKEEYKGLPRGNDAVSTIEPSGKNISLVVDLGGSVIGPGRGGSSETVNVQKENGEEDQLGFLVGDIVWALKKQQEWWPGQVIDYKADKKKSVMVRYFGQSQTTKWYLPSQLRPFNQNNFESLLKRGKDRSFNRAVEKVMAFLGASLKFEMTCPCFSEVNGKFPGIKPSLLHKFSVDRMESKEFLAQLKNLAECSSVSEILELIVMQSRLLAFNAFRGQKRISLAQLCENVGPMKPKKRVFGGSSEKVRKRRKLLSSVSIRAELVNASVSVLMSELRILSADHHYLKEAENYHLTESFFYKFRKSEFHDEHIYNTLIGSMPSEKDSILGKDSKRWAKSKNVRLKSFSDLRSDCGTNELRTKDYSREIISARIPYNKVFAADSLSGSATSIPNLNSSITTLSSTGPDHSHKPNTSISHEMSRFGGPAISMMWNFQPNSTFGTSGTDLNPRIDDVNAGQKKKKPRRKTDEKHPLGTEATTGLPDLNTMVTETISLVPQETPKQPRKRRKKEELPKIETQRTTNLVLKFASGAYMPSENELTSRFSGFGPLDAAETHVSEDSCSAEIAFMSCDDAIEAVKSLEKKNPFGETLVSFRLQQKPVISRNMAPRMPTILSVATPASRLPDPPNSVDVIRQNLMMMTSVLEKSGNSLSEEMRAKLKMEVTTLLKKVNSMPGCSSSSS